jgi:hypothetical protein
VGELHRSMMGLIAATAGGRDHPGDGS